MTHEWVIVKVWANHISIQHPQLSRLQVLRMLLNAARAVCFRWEQFTPYESFTTTGTNIGEAGG